KIIILDYVRRVFANMTLEEMKLAFVYASEGRFDIQINTYGDKFCAQYISAIFNAFRSLKMRKQKELQAKDSMTNKQQTSGILDILKNDERGLDTLELIKEVGSEKEREKKRLREEISNVPLPGEDKIQDYFKEFDKLRSDQNYKHGGGFAEYKEKVVNINEFISLKTKEND
ncbi:unnamed protein product, partial [marine sediment metagenome]